MMPRGYKMRLSYRWRLFMPLLAGIWILVLGMALWQNHRDNQFRTQYIDAQLNLVNSRIVAALNEGKAEVNADFLNFINKFYVYNKLFSGIRITIFNRDWDVVTAVGEPITLPENARVGVMEEVVQLHIHNPSLNDEVFYYKGMYSKSHEHIVVSALPAETPLLNFLSGDRITGWVFFLSIAVILSALVFYSMRRLSNNMMLLREFARRSASDPGFIPGSDFTHDELGDIARQIVSIYNERSKVRRRLDHEHAMAMKAIEERALQKRQMTNNINHELKTPIGVIKGYIDTLAENPDLDPDMRMHFIRKASEHINRLVDLIASVSTITRLEEGAGMINTEVFDYHDMVYQFANDIAESGSIGHMEFTYDVPMGTDVRGNVSLLSGMLGNLAKNAANYSNGTTCTLECLGLTEDKLFYEFAFYDDGVGVPDEALKHLFERFYRIDSGRMRKNGGTGLGLAIVYNTVTAHGGKIYGRNREDGGLEFRFTLPRAGKGRRFDRTTKK